MKIQLIIILSLLFTSCTTIFFEEAQPFGVNSLESFPTKLQGKFISETDTFIVEEKKYSFPLVYEDKISMDSVNVDPTLTIKDGLFYSEDIPLKTGIKYTIENDSLHYKKQIRAYKTLSDSLILKKFKKYYVLSELNNEYKYWTVMLIRTANDDLEVNMVGYLKTEDDSGPDEDYDARLDQFFKITEFKKIESHTYLTNPSKSEFKKLVDKGLFSADIHLGRIESNTSE